MKNLFSVIRDLFKAKKRFQKKQQKIQEKNIKKKPIIQKTRLNPCFIKSGKGCFGSGYLKYGKLVGKYS